MYSKKFCLYLSPCCNLLNWSPMMHWKVGPSRAPKQNKVQKLYNHQETWNRGLKDAGNEEVDVLNVVIDQLYAMYLERGSLRYRQ